MAWMYILRCADGTYYTGSTGPDVDLRVWEHNHDDERAAKYTRKRRPVRLVYAEKFDRVDDAFRREKQVQGWSRRKKEALIQERGGELPALSRSRSAGPSTGSGAGPSTGSGTGTGSGSGPSTGSGTGSG